MYNGNGEGDTVGWVAEGGSCDGCNGGGGGGGHYEEPALSVAEQVKDTY
jgi:hypothetical protein